MVRCKKCGKTYYEGYGFAGPGKYPDGIKKCEGCGANLTKEESKEFVGMWD